MLALSAVAAAGKDGGCDAYCDGALLIAWWVWLAGWKLIGQEVAVVCAAGGRGEWVHNAAAIQ